VVVGYNLREMSSNKELYKHSVFPRTISDWNKLPEAKALSPHLESFKSCISALTFEGFISSDLKIKDTGNCGNNTQIKDTGNCGNNTQIDDKLNNNNITYKAKKMCNAKKNPKKPRCSRRISNSCLL
jgi:hypothetical protein